MNERIRELADQALKECDAAKERGIDQYSKRFAELIVAECYLWAKENGGLGCEEDFEALKEHFGVEE